MILSSFLSPVNSCWPAEIKKLKEGSNMDELIRKAVQVMEENSWLNEVEVADASGRVRLVRSAPVIWYYQPPWQPYWSAVYQYQSPTVKAP
jgi:hypothetical protein